MRSLLRALPRPALLPVALGCLFLLPAVCHAQGFGGGGGNSGFGGKQGFNGGSGL